MLDFFLPPDSPDGGVVADRQFENTNSTSVSTCQDQHGASGTAQAAQRSTSRDWAMQRKRKRRQSANTRLAVWRRHASRQAGLVLTRTWSSRRAGLSTAMAPSACSTESIRALSRDSTCEQSASEKSRTTASCQHHTDALAEKERTQPNNAGISQHTHPRGRQVRNRVVEERPPGRSVLLGGAERTEIGTRTLHHSLGLAQARTPENTRVSTILRGRH